MTTQQQLANEEQSNSAKVAGIIDTVNRGSHTDAQKALAMKDIRDFLAAEQISAGNLGPSSNALSVVVVTGLTQAMLNDAGIPEAEQPRVTDDDPRVSAEMRAAAIEELRLNTLATAMNQDFALKA